MSNGSEQLNGINQVEVDLNMDMIIYTKQSFRPDKPLDQTNL
jgi:hypothetical protein